MNRILWNHGRGTIDELVLHDATVHVEQMDDTWWWIGVYLPDGTYWAGNFISSDNLAFVEQEGDVVWEEDREHE